MESENKSELPEPLPDEENSKVNGGICESKEGDHDDYDDDFSTDEKAQLLRVPVLFLVGGLIWFIFPYMYISSGLSFKPGDFCGFFCFFADICYLGLRLASSVVESVLISIFLWCMTGSKKLFFVVLFAGILILPSIVLFRFFALSQH